MKILVIDDDVQITSVAQQLLEAEGYRVTTAGDGNDGYLAYLDFKPDLVITDIQMPGRNGFELMREIRIHDPKIRTIFMSGGSITRFQSLLEEEEKRYHADFMAKPRPEMS